MKEVKYSENPIVDIWQKLLKYSYISNIEKLLEKDIDIKIKNTIAGSIIQSYEYFNSFKTVSLNTSPLLIYYGYVNLLNAVASIITKKNVEIKNHGLSLILDKSKNSIGNSVIKLSSSPIGAFKVFNDIFTSINDFPRNITLKQLLSYIPEIKSEFDECYSSISSSCIPVEIVKRRNDSLERIKLNDLSNTEFNYEDIVDFKNNYLEPQSTNKYIILRKKLTSEDIGIYSISGQKFLIKYYNCDNKKYILNLSMIYFLILYSLSVLSRYYPEKWFPFVQSDNSGEKGIIEDFLSLSYRVLPNMLLNKILDKKIVFTTNRIGYNDMSKYYDSDDVKAIVKDEMKKIRFR